MTRMIRITCTALAAATAVMGHSWVEQLRNIDNNGSYVGQYGYPRGMVSRTDPSFNGDSMNWQIPASNLQGRVFINSSDLLCHPSQRNQTQSQSKFPRLQSAPGSFLAMRYQENGHATFPQPAILGKPDKSGTVFVYHTVKPKADEKLLDVLQWTKDGQGGDKRGKLIGANDFDDGRCYLLNASPISQQRQKSDPNYILGQASSGPANSPLYCETDVQMPANVRAGQTQTLYWVWQWNTAPGIDPGLPNGKDEYYTTCVDVDIASNRTAVDAAPNVKFAIGQQDDMSVAAKGWNSRTALITDAIKGEVGPIFSSSSVGSLTGTGNGTGTSTGTSSATGGTLCGHRYAPPPNSSKSRSPAASSQTAPTAPPQLNGGGLTTVLNTVYVTVTVPAPVASSKTGQAASVRLQSLFTA